MLNLNKFISIFILLLGFAVAWQTPAHAATAVGQVIVASGDFVAVAVDGKSRPLKRKSEFYSGETLKTGADGRAQIKFIDDALVSLRPNTEFRVDEYRYDPANKDINSSATTLTKGSLRTITGLIAKRNPPSYKITTPVATIGVRGTDLELALGDDGLDIAFWKGEGTASNNAGKFNLGKDEQCQFAKIKNIDTEPVCQTAPLPGQQDSNEVIGDVTPDGALFSDGVNDTNENGNNDAVDDGTPLRGN